jgi:hypothetical protein
MALGGIMAALAVTIMSLGGLIPVATYVCPMLCAILLLVVYLSCGSRIAWAWYGAVAILSLLMGPDKEAAAVFVFLGYYPILKPWLDKRKLSLVWKLLLFNSAVLTMYWLLLNLFGMAQLAAEFSELGLVLGIVLLLMGNLTFFLLDIVLGRLLYRKGRR